MSARMGSFAIDSSLGFGLAVLRVLILKEKILTKCSKTTLLKAVCFCILHVIKKIECNNSMPSVVIEVEVTIVTKTHFLKCRLSASFRYPLLFRNETLLRRCLFIIKAESCPQHMRLCLNTNIYFK